MADTVVFQDATILDCTGRDPYRGVLVVAGDRIHALGPEGRVSVPRDAQVLDPGGMTLRPGLIDAHTHLGMVEADETVSVEVRHPGATYPLQVARR